MTTRQITYYKKLDSISSGDDNISLSQSLQFATQSSRKKLKLVAGTVSRSILHTLIKFLLKPLK